MGEGVREEEVRGRRVDTLVDQELTVSLLHQLVCTARRERLSYSSEHTAC
jgi:hypothetical protein